MLTSVINTTQEYIEMVDSPHYGKYADMNRALNMRYNRQVRFSPRRSLRNSVDNSNLPMTAQDVIELQKIYW